MGGLARSGRPAGSGRATGGGRVVRSLLGSNRHAVYFSFEHDAQSVLERLIVMEAAEVAGPTAVMLPRVRQAFEARHGSDLTLEERLAGTEGGAEAVQALQDYGPRLHIHRSSGSHTDVDALRGVSDTMRGEPGGQIVEDAHVVALRQQRVDDIGTDEPGPAGHNDLH